MKLSLKAGSTGETVDIFIPDSASTTGAGKSGLLFNTAGLTCYYNFRRGSATVVTLATLAAANSAWSSGGFKEIDATNQTGHYRFDIPDALLAAGNGRYVKIVFQGTGIAPTPLEIELTGWDNQDAVRGGMTALPNANAEAAGGLYTRGSGAGQINQDANGRIDVNAKAWAGTGILAASIPVATAAGAAGGLLMAGSNAATTFATLTSTGAFTINGNALDASKLDVAVSTRLAASSYTAPDNAAIDATFVIVNANLDAAVSSRLAFASYTAPDNANILTASQQATLARKLVGNKRITYASGAKAGTQELYDDDDSTILKSGAIYMATDGSASSPYDGSAAINRMNRLA